MISIIYPHDDIVAEDVAIKVAMDAEDMDIYPVPKYPGRNETLVFNNLKKSKRVIFIMTDPKIRIDRKTSNELKFVLEARKTLYSVVPEGTRIDKFSSETHKIIFYKDTNDLIKKLNNIINEIQQQENLTEADIEIVVPLLIIILGLMALLLVNAKAAKR